MNVFEYVYLTVVIIMTAGIVYVAARVHSHIWVRRGYEGKDQVLELKEVDRFIAHLVMWTSITCTFFFVGINPFIAKYMGFPIGIEFIGAMASFGIGSGTYIAFRRKPAVAEIEDDKVD